LICSIRLCGTLSQKPGHLTVPGFLLCRFGQLNSVAAVIIISIGQPTAASAHSYHFVFMAADYAEVLRRPVCTRSSAFRLLTGIASSASRLGIT